MARHADGTAARDNRGMQGEPIRRRAVVHGRVQGVFFRDTARQRARGLGLSGWIRNRPDGTVEAVIEGEPQAVQEMLRELRVGPPRARVDRLDVTEEPPEGLSGFQIR
jgi:acylphosphatase